MAYKYTTPELTLYEPLNDLNINKDFECLLILTNEQIETLYDDYVDEITKPLNFD